jgi:hypothetical protein
LRRLRPRNEQRDVAGRLGEDRRDPTDAAVMYLGETGVRLSEESIRLWERNTEKYVDDVERNRRRVSHASSVRSG